MKQGSWNWRGAPSRRMYLFHPSGRIRPMTAFCFTVHVAKPDKPNFLEIVVKGAGEPTHQCHQTCQRSIVLIIFCTTTVIRPPKFPHHISAQSSPPPNPLSDLSIRASRPAAAQTPSGSDTSARTQAQSPKR